MMYFIGQEPTRHLKLSSKKGKPVMWIMSGQKIVWGLHVDC